jgi:Family of unknown function (DUF5302)
MSSANDKGSDELADVKAKMREALDRKNKKNQGGDGSDAPLREKAHGSEVHGGATQKLHRRKSGG